MPRFLKDEIFFWIAIHHLCRYTIRQNNLYNVIGRKVDRDWKDINIGRRGRDGGGEDEEEMEKGEEEEKGKKEGEEEARQIVADN